MTSRRRQVLIAGLTSCVISSAGCIGDTSREQGATNTTQESENTNQSEEASTTESVSISSFGIDTESLRTLRVSFESTHTLSEIKVNISGDDSTTLVQDDFTEHEAESGSYRYIAVFDTESVGDFQATLREAVDVDGNDGATNQSASISTTDNIIDDFEAETLDSAWQGIEADQPVGEITTDESARENFSIQSETVGDGEYALKGDPNGTGEDSEIAQTDLDILSDGVTVQFYLKLGPILTGYEQSNQIHIVNENNKSIIAMSQKDWANDPSETGPDEYSIWSEKLNSLCLVKIKNINFSTNTIGEVTIDGVKVEENMSFGSDSSKLDGIYVHQGHHKNSHSLVLDEIVYY